MRLIDADNLLKKYERIDWYSVSKEGQFMRGATTEDNPFIHYYDGEDIIKNAPTVDAVPVVRCRDCQHWNPSGSKAGNSFSDMEYIGGCEFTNYCRRESDFCSYGERKEGAD